MAKFLLTPEQLKASTTLANTNIIDRIAKGRFGGHQARNLPRDGAGHGGHRRRPSPGEARAGDEDPLLALGLQVAADGYAPVSPSDATTHRLGEEPASQCSLAPTELEASQPEASQPEASPPEPSQPEP